MAQPTTEPIELTPDVRPEWAPMASQILDVIRRLQSVAKSKGCSVLTIHVLVDGDGVPWYWTSPTVTKLEPGAACNPELLLQKITE